MSLHDALEKAEADVARLRREIAAGTCRETGHDWQHIGGSNAGCCDDCACSVPMHQCSKCGDCDYGQNAEAEAVTSSCQFAWPLNREHEERTDVETA